MSEKRLYRSAREKKIAGVCGGLAEYFDVDPTIVRLITLCAILLGGMSIVLYLIAWIIMPVRPTVQGL